MSAGQLGKRLLDEVEQGTFDEVRYRFCSTSAPLIAFSPPQQHSLPHFDKSVYSCYQRSENVLQNYKNTI